MNAPDLATGLAARCNGVGEASEPAAPEDFWPLLRQLSDAGLVVGSEEPLATVQLGPFRLAQTPYREATRDFLDILLPALVVGHAQGIPMRLAVAGVLTAGTHAFLELLRRGVAFGRSPEDRLRWEVLVHIKERGAAGRDPTVDEVVTSMTRDGPGTGRSAGEVRAAVDWLLGTGETGGTTRPALLATDGDGGLRSLV